MRSLAKYFYQTIKDDYIKWKSSASENGVPGRLIFKEFDSKLVGEIVANLVESEEIDLSLLGSDTGFILAIEDHDHYTNIDYPKYEFSELAHERNRSGNYYCLMFIAEIKPTLEQVTGLDQSTVFELTELREWIKIAKYQHEDHAAFLDCYIDELARFIFELTNPSWNNRPFIEIDKIDAFIAGVIKSTIKNGLFYDALGCNCICLGGINRLTEFNVLKDSGASYRRVFRATVSKTLFKDIDWWRAINRNKEVDIDEIRRNISLIKDSNNDYDDFCLLVEQYFEAYFSSDDTDTKALKKSLQSHFDSMNPYASVLQAKSTKTKLKLGEQTHLFLVDNDISIPNEEQLLLESLDSANSKPDINELRKFYFFYAKELSNNLSLDKAWLKAITISTATVCSNFVEGILTILSKYVLINDIGDNIIELRLSRDRTKKSLLKKNWLALSYFNSEYNDLEDFWTSFGNNFKLDLGRPFKSLFVEQPEKKEQKERDGKAANELAFRVIRRPASCDETVIDSWELKWVFNPYGFESSKYIDFPKIKNRKGFFHKHQLSLDPLFIKRSERTPTINNVHMFLAVSAGLKKGAVVKKLDKESTVFMDVLQELQQYDYISMAELENVKGLYFSFYDSWSKAIETILDSPLCADLSYLRDILGLLFDSILNLRIAKEKTGELLHELLSAHTVKLTENNHYAVYLPWSPYSLLMQSERNAMLRAISSSYREKSLTIGNKNDGVLAKLFKELLDNYGKSFYFRKESDNVFLDLACTNANSGYFEYGKLSNSKNAITESEIKSAIHATATKFLETYPNERHHLQILCIGLLSYEHILAVYDELLSLTENHEEHLSISLSVNCSDRGVLDGIYQTICEGFERNKIDSNITIRIINHLDELEDGEIDIVYHFDPLYAHNKVSTSSPKYSCQNEDGLNWEYSASRKVPSDPISKKVLFALNNHIQNDTGVLFHSVFMRMYGLSPEHSFCREVSNYGLQEEVTAALNKCNWLVIYDYLLSKETLSVCQKTEINEKNNRRVLRYIQGEGSKRSLAIITDKETHHITNNLGSDIRAWNLVHPDKVEELVDKVFTISNNFSGDTLLRSVGNGNFSHDIVGTAGAAFLLDRLFAKENKVSPIFWIHLDDYMGWFKTSIEDDAFKSVGRNVNYISDLLGVYISVDEDKEATINIIISESKLTCGSEEQSLKSCKQIKSTVSLLESMLISSANIDFNYWLNKIYEFIVGHFKFAPNSFEFEDLISLRKQNVKINVHGISVVFHYNNETQPTESYNIYESNYLTQIKVSSADTQSTFRALTDQEFSLDILEDTDFAPLKLNRENKITKDDEAFILESKEEASQHEFSSTKEPSEMQLVEPEEYSDSMKELAEVKQEKEEALKLVDNEPSIPHKGYKAIELVKSSIEFLDSNCVNNEAEEFDMDVVKTSVREIFFHANLPSEFKDLVFTPNSIVVKLQGSVNLNPNKVLKLKDNFLSVVGLSLRHVYPAPGVIVMVFDRRNRETVYFGKLLLNTLETRRATIEENFNNKVLIGQNEFSEEGIFFKLDGASPHALIAGQTKSGKSILMNNMIVDLLMTNSPDNLKLRLFDPKQVEFIAYKNAPHLAHPVVLEKDEAVERLQELESLMNERYQTLMTLGIRDFESHNRKYPSQKMSREVVFFDELADWVLDSEFKDAAAKIIIRLSSKGRAAGIHLVLATQRPSAEVVLPQLRANLDTKIALKVDRDQNSEIILGESGAENLLGFGHGIVKTEGQTHFVQVGFTDDSTFDELVEKVVDFWS